MVASGGLDSEVRLFDQNNKTLAVLHGFSRSQFTTDIGPNGEFFLTAGGDGPVRIFKVILHAS